MRAASSIDDALAGWLREGLERIGEISITRDESSGDYLLCHHRDLDRARTNPEALERFTRPEEARAIGQFDESNAYRPLKTAPNLRSGWVMRLDDIRTLRESLDFFYPAMVGTWFYNLRGRAGAVPLRETLNRQTGMYRFAKQIDDTVANDIAGRLCHSRCGCLKKVLWPLDDTTPLEGLPASEREPESAPGGLADSSIPMLCLEACTLVVSAARKAARESFDSGESSP